MSRLTQKYGENYSASEVADFFDISEEAVYKWCRAGKCGLKVHGKWRIFQKDIDKLLKIKEEKVRKSESKKDINSIINKSSSIN